MSKQKRKEILSFVSLSKNESHILKTYFNINSIQQNLEKISKHKFDTKISKFSRQQNLENISKFKFDTKKTN